MTAAVRAMLEHLAKQRRRQDADRGFTVVELLVVLIVLPLIVGAIAEALIVSLKTIGPDTTRISDSENAQLSNAFFARDVEGASLVLTGTDSSNTVLPYSATNPQVCGAGNGTLEVAFFRPASGNSSALSVSYRLVGNGSAAKLIRYSCTVSNYTTAGTSMAVLASTAPSNMSGAAAETISGHVSITPVQFSTAAAQVFQGGGVWAPTSAYSLTNNAVTLTSSPIQYLDVSSTYEFTMPGNITVDTAAGPHVVSCTGMGTDTTGSAPTPAFTGCKLPTAGDTAFVGNGGSVTQYSITSVQLSVFEPGSTYSYNLVSNPQVTTSQPPTQICAQEPCDSPTMLLLGSAGFLLNGQGSNTCSLDNGNKDKVCIQGGVTIDGGIVNCGTGGVFASGGYTTAGSGVCNGTTVPSSQPVPDPYTSNPRLLPTCFAPNNLPSTGGQTVTRGGKQYDLPGTWTTTLSGTLEPGIYVAEAGVGDVTMATYSASDTYFNGDKYAGVLIYLPGPSGAYMAPCVTEPTATVHGLRGSVSIAPIDKQQSTYYFGTSALDGMAIWQDTTNATVLNVGSNTPVCLGDAGAVYGSAAAFSGACNTTTPNTTELYGLLYAPSMVFEDQGNGSISAGRMIIAGYQAQSGHGNGTASITLSGVLNPQ